MFLKHNDVHMALIQALGKRRGVLIPESKSFNQAYEGPLRQPLHQKSKIESAMCLPMACSSGGFHGNTNTLYVKWFCSTQMLLKDHVLDWWMVQK